MLCDFAQSMSRVNWPNNRPDNGQYFRLPRQETHGRMGDLPFRPFADRATNHRSHCESQSSSTRPAAYWERGGRGGLGDACRAFGISDRRPDARPSLRLGRDHGDRPDCRLDSRPMARSSYAGIHPCPIRGFKPDRPLLSLDPPCSPIRYLFPIRNHRGL
jgi:hypothetical protein